MCYCTAEVEETMRKDFRAMTPEMQQKMLELPEDSQEGREVYVLGESLNESERFRQRRAPPVPVQVQADLPLLGGDDRAVTHLNLLI